MNNVLDLVYQDLLQTIIDHGVEKKDRTGTGTKSIFGYQIRHDMQSGFPLLTTKKMYWKGIVTELLWFLRGDTDIRFLWKNNCTIWDGDWYKHYKTTCSEPYSLDEMKKFALAGDSSFHESTWDLGPIYGKQWRSWKHLENHNFTKITYNKPTDQIANLINDLKTNPDSRRLMVSAWNVGELDQMVLPPCHYGFQVYTRELSSVERMEYYGKHFMKETESKTFDELSQIDYDKLNIPTRAISLMWNQRSVDTFLGLPFNIASYGLLLEIIAKAVNMVPDQLIGNLGDVHLYNNHIEQAKEQIGRDLTAEERYNIWFNNNYETGMERYFDPNKLPNFDDPYYKPTPKRTREPYPLPKLYINDEFWNHEYQTLSGWFENMDVGDFQVENYQSHPTIKAPLSN